MTASRRSPPKPRRDAGRGRSGCRPGRRPTRGVRISGKPSSATVRQSRFERWMNCCSTTQFWVALTIVRNQRFAGARVDYQPVVHGRSGYARQGCRCDVCREAQAAYPRDYRARRRALGATRLTAVPPLPAQVAPTGAQPPVSRDQPSPGLVVAAVRAEVDALAFTIGRRWSRSRSRSPRSWTTPVAQPLSPARPGNCGRLWTSRISASRARRLAAVREMTERQQPC